MSETARILRPELTLFTAGRGHERCVTRMERRKGVAKRYRTSVDPHVLPSKLEEGRHILEDETEGVFLPVLCVIAEQDTALDVFPGG